ncbi:MAG TPA: hypothetical protein DCY27_02720 [Desulfobacterales bacterium]|nr:hypothetical protein [Desulfobacterales bacterium]
MNKPSIIIHQARWIVPVTGPVIEAGAVAIADGRIRAVGPAADLRRQPWDTWEDHGDGAIMPALVNAHTHLELTALRGRIAAQERWQDWLSAALAEMATLTLEDLQAGAAAGIAELRRFGTGLVAEISNTGLSLPALAKSGLEFCYFFECLGFDLTGAGPLETDFPIFAAPEALTLTNFSAAAHASYSVSSPLCQRIAAWNRGHGRLSAVHLAESREEERFLQTGDGFFRSLLMLRGRWRPDFQPPGVSPAHYLDSLGFFAGPALAAHGVWLDAADRKLLARRGARVVLCPRSNLFTGTGFPNLTALEADGVRLALGTDSLASNHDLNLFRELEVLREQFPAVPPGRLVRLATLNGAAALGREADLGSLEPGKQAALLLVPVDAGAGDFWDALLAAGAMGEVRWLSPPKETCHA